MKRYVIAGNGIAAARCIEGIRSRDPEGPITVISQEDHDVYCRPLISYYLEGRTDREKMRYRDPDFYERTGCQVLFGKKAAALDAKAHLLTLDDGSVIPYDALCVATGSAPFVPPFEGLESVPDVFSFMTLDDALALESALRPGSRVLIIGAGLIGLKCAEGILDRCAGVTVCDLAPRVLSSILDDECAAMMQKRLEENGIRFMLGDTAVRFDGTAALMKSGKTVTFDLLVLAVGVRANSALVRDAGGNTNRGILTDTRMKTSLPDVWAAGDCCEGPDLLTGEHRVLAILPNASMQGYTAGVNMSGGDLSFDRAVPMNAIGFFGLHAMTAGVYDGELYEEKTPSSLKRLFIKDDRLRGFILIGCDERAGIYTSLIREGTPLSSIDFERMKHGATTAAFGARQRKEKFGGAV